MSENVVKNEAFQGFIATHKKPDYELPNNELWTPVEAGAAFREPLSEEYRRDNEGEDNISKWNRLYFENTVLYWIWKNMSPDCKTVAFCQYRRQLPIDTVEDLKEMFKGKDLITCQPIELFPLVIQYSICHSRDDIELTEKIVKELYPDYADDWDKVINNGKELYYSNGFAMKAKDFKKYCKWLFSIFDEFRKRMEWETPEQHAEYFFYQLEYGKRRRDNGKGSEEGALDYQSGIFGFLSERLFTLYVKHNYKKERILELPYRKFENV